MVSWGGVIALLLIVAVLALNVHTCDRHEGFFFGTQYYDALQGFDCTLCGECAQAYYGDPLYLQYRK